MDRAKLRYVMLVVGLTLLLIGAVLNIFVEVEWGNYVLVAGAAIVIIRGFVKQ